MAVAFVLASSQYLTRAIPETVPTTIFPLTVGAWVYPKSANTMAFFSIGDNTVTNQYGAIRRQNTGTVSISAAAGSSESSANNGVAINANTWNFVVGRFISATNRRVGVLHSTSVISHASGTTSRAPTGANEIRVSGHAASAVTNAMDGRVAEWWYATADVQPDGAQIQDQLLRALAFGGPFSVPAIAKNIVEYRSFRTHPTCGDLNEIYFGGGSTAAPWTNTGGATIEAHPPFPYWYVRPGQHVKAMVPI